MCYNQLKLNHKTHMNNTNQTQGSTIEFKLNYNKIVQSILYVINQKGGNINKYNLMKVMFAADKYHMLKYIRPVTGDKYIKMQYGTVPSKILNMVDNKSIKTCLKELGLKELPFQLSQGKQKLVSSKTKADTKFLSKSDMEALDYGIKEYADLKFNDARDKNHKEDCWINADMNKQISFESIAKGNPDGVEYLQACSRTLVL